VKGLAEIKAANTPKQKPRASLVLRFEVTPQVYDALEALQATGFFGNGDDVESVAEELLRAALRREDVGR